jgi:hypothetical protein
MDPYGYQLFRNFLPKEAFSQRSLYRFYHPEMLEKIASELVFHVEMNTAPENQRGYSFLFLSKK